MGREGQARASDLEEGVSEVTVRVLEHSFQGSECCTRVMFNGSVCGAPLERHAARFRRKRRLEVERARAEALRAEARASREKERLLAKAKSGKSHKRMSDEERAKRLAASSRRQAKTAAKFNPPIHHLHQGVGSWCRRKMPDGKRCGGHVKFHEGVEPRSPGRRCRPELVEQVLWGEPDVETPWAVNLGRALAEFRARNAVAVARAKAARLKAKPPPP